MSKEATVEETSDVVGHVRRFHRPMPPGLYPDPPDLDTNPLNLFTLPYMELIESIADRLFPENSVIGSDGKAHSLKASAARIDRYILFRAAWSRQFGERLQLALRDFSAAVMARHRAHFAALPQSDQIALLEVLEGEDFTVDEWVVLRTQRDAFSTIYDAVCEGFFGEPGYGGNFGELGWYYSNFMGIGS
jgi:hypothetical protein